MIVEVFIEDGSVYYINEDGIRQYLCSKPSMPFKEAKYEEPLKSGEVVELSKSGIRADELIRLRKEGII